MFNDKLVTTYDLKKLYKNKYTHDVCSFRDLSIVMAENPKLFISTKNHCWQRIKINNFKDIDIYQLPSYNDEYEVQKSENINESEIVQILTKILIDNGPLRISKIIKEFNKVSNSKFSTSSVSCSLIYARGFYFLLSWILWPL